MYLWTEGVTSSCSQRKTELIYKRVWRSNEPSHPEISPKIKAPNPSPKIQRRPIPALVVMNSGRNVATRAVGGYNPLLCAGSSYLTL